LLREIWQNNYKAYGAPRLIEVCPFFHVDGKLYLLL